MVENKIIWSHHAKIKLFEILNYFAERNKSKLYSVKLLKRFTNALELIQKHPELGKKTEIDSVRGIIVDNYILFYEKKKNNIVVLTLWDCRQNTDNLKTK
jgi:addiction module RelE/StbE family toxin